MRDNWMHRLSELIRYGLWGMITICLNLAVFYLMLHVGIDYLIANVLSYCLAVFFSYFFNQKYVFNGQATKCHSWKLIKFVFVRIVSICIDSGLLYLFVTTLKKDAIISKLIISSFIIIATYIFNKLFVFQEEK